jgi:translation initiation factor IF-1
MDPDGEGSAGRRSQVGVEAGVGTTVEGVVTEQLPSGLYRVRLDGGSVVMAHVADRIDRNFVRLIVADRVKLKLSPVDLGRGRIVEKL